MVVLGCWLDLMILEVFSSLNDSMIPYQALWHLPPQARGKVPLLPTHHTPSNLFARALKVCALTTHNLATAQSDNNFCWCLAIVLGSAIPIFSILLQHVKQYFIYWHVWSISGWSVCEKPQNLSQKSEIFVSLVLVVLNYKLLKTEHIYCKTLLE